MPRILIANADNESMIGDCRVFTEHFCRESIFASSKMAWLANPMDIVVLPSSISGNMKEYIAKIMGYSPADVKYVYPIQLGDFPRPIGSKELFEGGVLGQLLDLIEYNGSWELFPYIYDRSIARLSNALGITSDPSKSFLDHGGSELLNGKKAFRSFAASRGVPIARGVVCTSQVELENTLNELIAETGAVIIKQDRHASAEGNIVVCSNSDLQPQGALNTIIVDEPHLVEDLSRLVWSRLSHGEGASLVAEVYYPPSAILYAEFRVSSASRSVQLLNWGEQRMEPTFRGFVIPGNIKPYQTAKFVSGATELARMCVDLGFDGLMDVDAVITRNNEIVYNEINGRTGGCSHIHHIASKVFGPDYGDEIFVTAHDNIRSINFSHVLRLLDCSELAYSPLTKRGVIVTAGGFDLDVVDFVAIGRTREDALKLEREFEATINPAEPAAAFCLNG